MASIGGLVKKSIEGATKLAGQVSERIGGLGDDLGSPLISNLGTRLGRYNSYTKAIRDTVYNIFDDPTLSNTIPDNIAKGIKNRNVLKDIDGFNDFMTDSSISSTLKDKINEYESNLRKYTDRLEINRGTLRANRESLFNKKDIVLDTASKVEDKAGKVKEAVSYTPEQIEQANSDLMDMVTETKKVLPSGYKLNGKLVNEEEYRDYLENNLNSFISARPDRVMSREKFDKTINEQIASTKKNKNIYQSGEIKIDKPIEIKQLIGRNEDGTNIYDSYMISRNTNYDSRMLGSKKFDTYALRGVGLKDGKDAITVSKDDKEFVSDKVMGRVVAQARDAGIMGKEDANTILTALNVAQDISQTGAGVFSGIAELSGQIPSWAIYGGIGFGAMALLNSFNNRRDY